jgi:hypothetical protein
LQRAPERVRGFFVFELLEQRDAEIIRAVRIFASIGFPCSFEDER